MPGSGQLQTKEPWFVVSLSLLCPWMFWRWDRLFKCCLQDVVFLRIARSSELSCSLSYTKQKSMENYAVRLSSTVCDSSTTIADTVRCLCWSALFSNTDRLDFRRLPGPVLILPEEGGWVRAHFPEQRLVIEPITPSNVENWGELSRSTEIYCFCHKVHCFTAQRQHFRYLVVDSTL